MSKKKSVKNDMRYVAYVVSMYLRGKSELEEFREDLSQEGLLALLKARKEYNPKIGFPKNLFLHYRIKQAIQNYIGRTEVKHFKGTTKVEEEETSDSYWDLTEPVYLDDLIDTNSVPVDADRIEHFLSRIEMSEQEEQIVSLYLCCGNYAEVGKEVGLSRVRILQIVNGCIEKMKNLLNN